MRSAKKSPEELQTLRHTLVLRLTEERPDVASAAGENTENGKNRMLRLWHVRRSRAVLGLSVAVSGWSTAQPGVRRSGERASE